MTKSFRLYVLLLLSLVSMASPAQAIIDRPIMSPKVSVIGNINLDKFETLMQQGFKSVIVNRPDEETGNQVSVHQLRSIAEKSQVSVIYQPVHSNKISLTDVQEFAKYYNELPKPILMICRSGSRSSSLYLQAKAQGLLDE